MTAPQRESGFTLIEVMISMTLLAVIAGGLAGMMVDSSRVNRSQQMRAEARSSAYNCLTLIVNKLRSAGWDPTNSGISAVGLDPDLSDDVSLIEVFADLDADGFTDKVDEQVLIRHVGDRVEWRPTADVSQPFVVLATGITNDANGDGVIEPMFQPDTTTGPRRIRVTVTAQSPDPHPVSGEFIRFTASTDVVLRGAL